MIDWSAISNGATGAGTLVLAIATFASVRSSNKSARVAERALLMGMRPVLVPSRRDGPEEKIFWGDDHHVRLPAGEATAEIADGNIYVAMSLRNVGNGFGVLQGWHVTSREANPSADVPDLTDFRPQIRDLYVPSGDLSFWQAGLRDEQDSHYQVMQTAITLRQPFLVYLLYSDHEGGQRTITRFVFNSREDDRWLVVVARHWNLDRPDPR